MKALAYSLTVCRPAVKRLQSGINLFAALTAYVSLHYSQRPVDATHTYGHEKIEFFSSGWRAYSSSWPGSARPGWRSAAVHHQDLDNLGLGTGLALGASAVNLAVGLVLIGPVASTINRPGGRRPASVDGRLTSVGVVAGLMIVWASGVYVLDPVIAILVRVNIVFTGHRLIRRSFNGLMDHALDTAQLDALRAAVRTNMPPGTGFHALRTRQARASKFADSTCWSREP